VEFTSEVKTRFTFSVTLWPVAFCTNVEFLAKGGYRLNQWGLQVEPRGLQVEPMGATGLTKGATG